MVTRNPDLWRERHRAFCRLCRQPQPGCPGAGRDRHRHGRQLQDFPDVDARMGLLSFSTKGAPATRIGQGHQGGGDRQTIKPDLQIDGELQPMPPCLPLWQKKSARQRYRRQGQCLDFPTWIPAISATSWWSVLPEPKPSARSSRVWQSRSMTFPAAVQSTTSSMSSPLRLFRRHMNNL